MSTHPRRLSSAYKRNNKKRERGRARNKHQAGRVKNFFFFFLWTSSKTGSFGRQRSKPLHGETWTSERRRGVPRGRVNKKNLPASLTREKRQERTRKNRRQDSGRRHEKKEREEGREREKTRRTSRHDTLDVCPELQGRKASAAVHTPERRHEDDEYLDLVFPALSCRINLHEETRRKTPHPERETLGDGSCGRSFFFFLLV